MDQETFTRLWHTHAGVEMWEAFYGTDFKAGPRWCGAWCEEGSRGIRPGVHLRASNGPRSATLWGDHNRVWIDDTDAVDLPALIAESVRLSAMRAGGHVSKKPFGNLFAPLAQALEVCRDPPPVELLHAGGPKLQIPLLLREAESTVCRRLAERLRHTVTPDEEGYVETMLEHMDVAHIPEDPRLVGLYDVIHAGEPSPGLLATYGAYFSFTDTVLVQIVQWMDAQGAESGPMLLEVDQLLMRCELDAHLQKRKRAPWLADSVIWRGADEKNRPAYWISRKGGVFHFFGKLGRRWVQEQGDRESMLALVPDALFDRAVGRVLGAGIELRQCMQPT